MLSFAHFVLLEPAYLLKCVNKKMCPVVHVFMGKYEMILTKNVA